MSSTTSMKAAVLGEQGLQITSVERPRPGPDQVLIRVHASALNHADLIMLSGAKHGSHGGPGTVLGLECAGEVVALGSAVDSQVHQLSVGDRVMASGAGAFAEYAVIDRGRAMQIFGSSVSYQQAAGLPIALQTLHDALVTNGRLGSADVVLIQGASSGVGLMGLQMARVLGARRVIGTSTNPQRRARLAEFGADLALDSADPTWPQQLLDATDGHGADLTIDMLSGEQANQNLRAAALAGRIVNVGRLAGREAKFDFDLHALKRIEYIGVTFRTRTVDQVREITRKMAADCLAPLREGRLLLPVDQVFALDDLGAAFERMKRNQHFGKIVIAV